MINPRSDKNKKKKIKVDLSDLGSDRFEIGTWLNLRACRWECQTEKQRENLIKTPKSKTIQIKYQNLIIINKQT